MKAINLVNKTFNKLTVIEEAPRSNTGLIRWLCKCECGKTCIVQTASLVNGKTKSCGCWRKLFGAIVNKTHGLSKTPEFLAWERMKGRCYNKNNKRYKDYGGRGIVVCKRWLGANGFNNFLKDMGNRPSESHSLERIKNNRGYSKSNCKWATRKEQQSNRRNTRFCTIGGIKKTITDWCEIYGNRYHMVMARIGMGWSVSKAIQTKKRGT